ncbi:MAG: hypothetical protein M3352_05410 [Bacteroidota bacterium]|nr:hypothetical protein [Bacteroidota bacterium]
MKIFFTFILLSSGLLINAQKTEFSIGNLVELTAIHKPKLGENLRKKGYKPVTNEETQDVNTFKKIRKDKISFKQIDKFDQNDTATVIFQTSFATEFNQLLKELSNAGFYHPEKPALPPGYFPLYQKGSITIQPSKKIVDERFVYFFKVQRKLLPTIRDVVFAEDLLQLTSHEHLAAVFGSQNVKKDLFYFSENEMNKCSVLFPNTSMQVIVVWKDEINNQGISFLIIGGQLKEASANVTYNMEYNKWRSSNGVYAGMTLRQLIELNENPVNFYGWETDQPGLLTKQNTGKIDFNKVGIQLNCLDCSPDNFYTNNNLISSSRILNNNSRVFVSTIIIIP